MSVLCTVDVHVLFCFVHAVLSLHSLNLNFLLSLYSIGGAVLVGLSPSNNRSQGGENKYVGFIMVIAGAIL